MEFVTGVKKWYFHGNLHRTDGPAIEFPNGDQEWRVNDKLHRTDGPARFWAYMGKWWFVNGECHRTDGPAMQYNNGDQYWYIRNRKVSKSEVVKQVSQRELKVLFLSKVVNPFCEINVGKYAL
jgi:hypothetical protein